MVAGGGSSGATIAAFAAYSKSFEPDDEDRSISGKPDALVLINPAFGLPKAAAESPLGVFITSWKVTPGGPPAILFFGTEDPLQETARDFAGQLLGAGTRAEFYTAAGQKHGFFNRSRSSPWHALVLRQADLFLVSLGYLEGSPTATVPTGSTEVLERVHF